MTVASYSKEGNVRSQYTCLVILDRCSARHGILVGMGGIWKELRKSYRASRVG